MQKSFFRTYELLYYYSKIYKLTDFMVEIFGSRVYTVRDRPSNNRIKFLGIALFTHITHVIYQHLNQKVARRSSGRHVCTSQENASIDVA